MFMLIDAVTGEIVLRDQPADVVVPEGQQLVMQASSETMQWHPPTRGWVSTGSRRKSKLEYQRLYTQAERIGIRASTIPVVIDMREMLAIADYVDLDDPDVVGGNQYLEHVAGLIGAGRAAQILAGIAP